MNIPTTLASMLDRAEPPKCTCGRSLMMYSPDYDICPGCGRQYGARISGLYDREKPRLVRALQRVWEECEGVCNDYINGQCSPGRWEEAKSIQSIITEELGR